MLQTNPKTPKPISKAIQRAAKSERDRARALLGADSYRSLVEPYFAHLRAAMQRHNCEALPAARYVIDTLQGMGCVTAVQLLVTYAAVDLQFGEPLEVAA